MFTDQPRPHLLRFLLVDPLVLSAWLILLASGGMAALVGGLGYIPLGIGRLSFSAAEMRWLMGGMAAVVLVALPVLVLRIRAFRLATANPVESQGAISRVDTRWWGRRIQYFYFFQGDKRHGQAFSLRTRWVMGLSVADEVVVVYNQYWPERSVMRGLYVREE